jgi:hypothetical protein
MGVRILYDDGRRSEYSGSQAALYCSTTGIAFGPVFSDDHQRDADERVEAFLRFIKAADPRSYSHAEIMAKYSEFLAQEVEQYAAEAKAEEEAAAELDRELLLAFPVKGPVQ